MRVCLFTGASGTLGADFISRYSDRYMIAALIHNRPPPEPAPAVVLRLDLSRRAEILAAVDDVTARLGRIDLVVNAAATSLGRLADPADPLRRYLDVLAVNVAAPAWVTSAVAAKCWLPHAAAQRRSVVNISSTSGHIAYPRSRDLAYPASKAALDMLTIQMADDLEPYGVRVNAIAPTTFPRLIPTSRVSDAIVELDDSAATGRILVLEEDRRYWLDEQDPA